MNETATPRLIGLDWGTSSLRAYLLGENGEVLDTRSKPWGILHTPDGDFSQAFRELVGDWREQWPSVPAVAAGMIGSRQGWREVSYVECPADVESLAKGLLTFDSGCGELSLIPGVMQRGALPNVLRGEETQIFGALDLEPALAEHALLVLPGTHSKWATIRNHRIDHFSTYMTGELFAVLREHSILGQPAREEGSEPSAEAFQRGLINARDSGAEGVIGRLFTTRSLFLAGDLPARHSLDYLSGLLIGEELRSVVANLNGSACPPLVLIGDPALCRRYQDALAFFDITDVRLLEQATRTGLWRIALAAGLVAAESPSSEDNRHV
ncbi:2-dehydro-3-deoxygalactonokinase [Pseudomonas duriflava]|uniref:2-dehydro-3-deoxygalactonokinase n=1 Tax=Pseudomonas duriflava TaxID=459528 RepID=A0A562PY33_9PSED|nr:2-dehydro-3-deoxygalactonokinase [Pseudomonas duriflava]TWI49313.1 2-dehydro-3-deoxygalactonokinase [Pseudomonas duriflava]